MAAAGRTISTASRTMVRLGDRSIIEIYCGPPFIFRQTLSPNTNC